MKASNNIGKCVNCNSINIDYEGCEMVDDMISYEYSCNDCGSNGKEWYEITYVESIEY